VLCAGDARQSYKSMSNDRNLKYYELVLLFNHLCTTGVLKFCRSVHFISNYRPASTGIDDYQNYGACAVCGNLKLIYEICILLGNHGYELS